jgi:hypothetical protein
MSCVTVTRSVSEGRDWKSFPYFSLADASGYDNYEMPSRAPGLAM